MPAARGSGRRSARCRGPARPGTPRRGRGVRTPCRRGRARPVEAEVGALAVLEPEDFGIEPPQLLQPGRADVHVVEPHQGHLLLLPAPVRGGAVERTGRRCIRPRVVSHRWSEFALPAERRERDRRTVLPLPGRTPAFIPTARGPARRRARCETPRSPAPRGRPRQGLTPRRASATANPRSPRRQPPSSASSRAWNGEQHAVVAAGVGAHGKEHLGLLPRPLGRRPTVPEHAAHAVRRGAEIGLRRARSRFHDDRRCRLAEHAAADHLADLRYPIASAGTAPPEVDGDPIAAERVVHRRGGVGRVEPAPAAARSMAALMIAA